MKLRDAIRQDFFMLRAAAEATKTPLTAHLNDLDRFVPEDTLTYEQHCEMVGRVAAEASEIARDTQVDLDTVQAELMKLVDRLGNPDVEQVGYVRLWDQPPLAKEVNEQSPSPEPRESEIEMER